MEREKYEASERRRKAEIIRITNKTVEEIKARRQAQLIKK